VKVVGACAFIVSMNKYRDWKTAVNYSIRFLVYFPTYMLGFFSF
jgi:hypothetical protein